MDAVRERSGLDAHRRHLAEMDDRRRVPDRRRASRRKILKAGQTLWPNGDSSECLVCNLSETGAQLDIRGPIPNIFDLVIDGDPRRRSCSVIWRNANRAGVKFQEQTQLVPSPKSLVGQVSECKRFAEMCFAMSERAVPSDRQLFLEMANAWLIVVRYLQRKSNLHDSSSPQIAGSRRFVKAARKL
jgi:hypothetical protein